MSYSQFVRALVHCITDSKGIQNRQIIHFTNRQEYNTFMRQFLQLRPNKRIRSSIRKLSLINGVCFQGRALPTIRHPGIRMVESDCRIHMRGRSDLNNRKKKKLQRHSGRAHLRPKPGGKPKKALVRPVAPYGTIPWGVQRIRAPKAWKHSIGGKVKVAVIDTGVDFRHPDLSQSLAPGLNLLNPGMMPWDDNGHGTHIIGTLAGIARQNSGIWGTAPGATIFPIKAFDRNGSAYVSDIIQGLDWCIRNGIRLINMSFGMTTSSRAFQQAVKNACAKGAILVASAGNDGKRVLDYPAHYPCTIAVGATNRRGDIAKFSNRTSRVHIYAPGQNISSTWLRNGYTKLSGTVNGDVSCERRHCPCASTSPRLVSFQGQDATA